jgi:hypothetical protein
MKPSASRLALWPLSEAEEITTGAEECEGMRRTCIVVVAALVAIGVFAASAPAKAGKVTICHRTGNGSFLTIRVASQAAASGHLAHPGDIVNPAGGVCPAGSTTGTDTGGPDPTDTSSSTATATGSTSGGGAVTTGGPGGATARGELPFTGIPVWVPLLAASGLLILGGLLLERSHRAR